MKILIVIGPALGTINHALALSNLLQENGHEVIWLTGPDARAHLKKMKSPYETYYSKNHNLKFKANNPGGLPHFVYSTRYEYLKKSTEYELKIISRISPELIITKHHYSSTISSRISSIPFAYYCTDGVEYSFKDRNPHNRWKNEQGIDDYLKICQEFGLVCERREYTTDYLFSPFLNIIRGVPLIFSLTKNENVDLKKNNSVIAGLLTYDGPTSRISNSILDKIPKRCTLIYITFGTHYYERERIDIFLRALIDFEGYILVSTGYFDPSDFNSNSQNVIFVKYIPNNQVADRANIIIHHAGSGTTLTSFSYGVPQIVIPNNPNYSGQVYFARTIEKNGCGKHIPFENLNEVMIRAEIKRMLLSPNYKKNAENIKKEIHRQNLECNRKFLIQLSQFKKHLE